MCPERRRRTVESVWRSLGHEKVSEKRVCRVLGQNRGTQRHRPRKVDGDRELLGVMRKIVESFPRHGSERTHQVLTGPDAFGGWKVNFKRVHRIWKEEHMQVPRKQRKRRRLPGGSANGCIRHRATHRNHVWSYDFLTERTEDGRQLRILVVIDEFTRECLAIEVARSFTAQDVTMTLQYLFAVRGAPEHLRSDNGPEFVAKEIQEWLARACVRTLYIQKASPWENGYVESFNGRLRDELLDRELFLSLPEARVVLDQWRMDYNHRRPSLLDWTIWPPGRSFPQLSHEHWYKNWEGVSPRVERTADVYEIPAGGTAGRADRRAAGLRGGGRPARRDRRRRLRRRLRVSRLLFRRHDGARVAGLGLRTPGARPKPIALRALLRGAHDGRLPRRRPAHESLTRQKARSGSDGINRTTCVAAIRPHTPPRGPRASTWPAPARP